jgi:tRNA/tmRNA/rRNA uracil-C5-methylase (TrmA/RlmC/RlmD family)
MTDSVIGVTVRGIAAGGSGVADLPDGRVVFVPRTAPGDRASIRIVKSRPRWAEGALDHIDEPSPERREPPCRLFSQCGGCQLQHLPYSEQLVWKARIVADQLSRIGHLEGVEPPEVVASPLETEYRNRISFTLRRLRGGLVVAGFHALGRPAHVVDVKGEGVDGAARRMGDGGATPAIRRAAPPHAAGDGRGCRARRGRWKRRVGRIGAGEGLAGAPRDLAPLGGLDP